MKEKKVSFLKFRKAKTQTMLQVIEELLHQYQIVRFTEVTKIELIPDLMKLFLVCIPIFVRAQTLIFCHIPSGHFSR